MSYSNIIEEAIYNNPKSLLSIKDKGLIKAINNYLPYSTGFEIECDYRTNYDVTCFQTIPNIMEVRNDKCEQRYRIPSGLTGLICLQDICEQLRLNSKMNMESGIHYHIDCTDWFSSITTENLKDNEEWILKELDKWEYKGTYNRREVFNGYGGYWVRTNNEFSTLEIRCGEMSFDYNYIVTKIIHANLIVKNLKNIIFNPLYKIELLNRELQELNNQITPLIISDIEKKNFIKNKIIRL